MYRVVEGEGSSNQRIIQATQPQHQELPWKNAARHIRAVKPQAVGIPSQAHILLNFDLALDGLIRIVLRMQWVAHRWRFLDRDRFAA
jgi:hypothetical protein